MSDYEPPAEMVDALERDIRRLTGVPYNLGQTMSVAILRRQHEREKPLLGEMRAALDLLSDGYPSHAQTRLLQALAAHAKLDAPKVPTLAEAVEQIERECPGRVIATLKDSQAWTIIKLAAVEREEKR